MAFSGRAAARTTLPSVRRRNDIGNARARVRAMTLASARSVTLRGVA